MSKNNQEIKNPFSDFFLEKWQNWKDYKKQEFNFQYKGFYSEQAALMELVNLAEGDEETANKIILQSLANGWKGFWPIRKPTSNGKGKEAKLRSIKPTTDNLKDRVQSEIDKRYGNWQTPGSESHSKAV